MKNKMENNNLNALKFQKIPAVVFRTEAIIFSTGPLMIRLAAGEL